MSREIKFRGKRIDNNEWDYGCLINYLPNNNPRIISCEFLGEQNEPDYRETNNEIHSSSLGQFTGLYDKNGVEIYEGSILKFIEGVHKNETFYVKYKTSFFQLLPIEDKHLKQYTIRLDDESNTQVIGNIHDNPELL